MSHWRLYTLRLLAALFLVLFILLVTLVHAQVEEEEDFAEWLPCENVPDSPMLCAENVYEARRNVYRGRVLNALPEYVEDEGLSVEDVEDGHVEEENYEEYYREGYSLPHCPQTNDEEEER